MDIRIWNVFALTQDIIKYGTLVNKLMNIQLPYQQEPNATILCMALFFCIMEILG
jgi:hypothetical protein